jgi:hypothetical protein
MGHHEHEEDRGHRYERLDEAQLRDGIAKAEAQEERVEREGSPEAQRMQDERKETLRDELQERLEERREGTPAEGKH